MNKLYLLILFVVIGCVAPKPMSLTEYASERTIVIDDYNKDHLYVNTNRWMARLFNDVGNVIQYQDKEAGVIVGKFTANSESFNLTNVKMSIEVLIKEGKAKMLLRAIYYPIDDEEGEYIPEDIPKRAHEYYKLVQSKERSSSTTQYNSWGNKESIARYWDVLEYELKSYLLSEMNSL